LKYILDWVLPLFVGSGAAIAILVFLSKKLIGQQLNKGMEEFKAQLTEKTESLKHNLSIYAHERNVQATRVDSQKAKAIQSVYRSIVILLKYADKFSNDAPDPVPAFEEYIGHDAQKASEYRFYKENAEFIKSSSLSLSDSLLDNAIFIDFNTYKMIGNMQSSFLSLSSQYLDPITAEECGRDDIEEIVDDLLEIRKRLACYYNEELVDVKEEIILNFRSQLGTEQI
jgi:Sec-independent protein translocase protein TatA